MNTNRVTGIQSKPQSLTTRTHVIHVNEMTIIIVDSNAGIPLVCWLGPELRISRLGGASFSCRYRRRRSNLSLRSRDNLCNKMVSMSMKQMKILNVCNCTHTIAPLVSEDPFVTILDTVLMKVASLIPPSTNSCSFSI